jgi:colicin import membrane protein
MSEQKESSVLFSLKELMNLEEDRIKTEETSKAEQARQAEQARLDAERAARDAEEARIQAENEKRRLDEARQREETARLDAIRQAEVEKARVEAERQAQLAAMAAQQQHERQLEAVRNDEGKKKLRNVLIGVAVVVPLIAGGVGYMVYTSNQEKQQQIAAQKLEAERLAEERAKLEAKLKESDSRVSGLQGQLENEKDEAKRRELQKQLADAEREKANIGRQVGGPGPGKAPSGDSGAKKPCNCNPSDPLCDCL